MNINNIWDKLRPIPETLANLKRDLKEGKVPELPYFVVNQDDAKAGMGVKLNAIDGTRMQSNLIIGHYGNGKTNLLKYLKLFFQTHAYNIEVIYSRVDIEQPDIILYLLKLIQDHHTETLIEAVKSLKVAGTDWNTLIHNSQDTFGAIKEFTEKLFSDDVVDEDIKKLIFLGTGRLYTKGHFTAFGLQQLQNFNRREILVLFLNILSASNKFIVFGLDEVEKILEKSKSRFNLFLTSYRELIDLFNKINGHYLITCFTDASGTAQLEVANPAFYTRISPDIIELLAISKNDDIKTLSGYLDELFTTNKQTELDNIVVQVAKKRHPGNRDLIRHIVQLLFENDVILNLADALESNNLTSLFGQTKRELENDGILKSLHQKFFDPFEYFLEDSSRMLGGSILDRRKNQAFIDVNNNVIHHLIFNENSDIDNINKKINELVNLYNMKIVIYSPIKLELSNSSIQLENEQYGFTIISYEPEELFILLNMYRENFDKKDSIDKVISIYTNNNL
ncbi:hypothetical protein [Pedobacter alluvionis]|uniref:ATP-binding protein n=1 Tax=Pedobacter alluvionis TaxID=475253 RepID=A0A497Y584_9SPHI|nr:hypothetical protein [Pedobacter alluvionis]RLJ77330.1 hypothetical protein BCL90_2415 [Pedobacter alluvionis]TFB33448.1 hypothetical protein E3V97_05215 [Pedobacter alluvionis]